MSSQPANRFRTISGRSIAVTLVGMAMLIPAFMLLSQANGGFGNGQADVVARLAHLPVAIHLITVLPALPLGAYILWAGKGTPAHKALGRIWAGLMLVTSVVSFWIGQPGHGIAGTGYSFIHIFSVVTLVSIPAGIAAARRGDIRRHQRAMTGPYIGLVIAGLFAFVSGRILGTLVFG